MSSFKHQEFNEDNPPPRSKGYDLWYYQLRGDRYYFRLAPLGLALIIIPTILSLVALVVLFFYRTASPVKKPDITITSPPAPTDPTSKSVIQRAPPPPTPPQVRNRPNINSMSPMVTPLPGRNINGQ